jgi:hypothetical protein
MAQAQGVFATTTLADDPFMTQAGYGGAGVAASTKAPVALPGSNFHIKYIALLVFVPWTTFVIVIVASAVPPPGTIWSTFTFAVCLLSIVVGLLFCQFYWSGRKGSIHLIVGLLTCLATIVAYGAGSEVSSVDMVNYWTYRSGVTYSNVPPNKPADAFQDSNIIDFTQMSRLDLRQVFGFRPHGTSSTYCVAPIIESDNPSKEINFWAAGMDCCEPRRSFICGDASNMVARSGIVFPANSSTYSAHRWQQFRKSAQLAADLYGLSIPEYPIFVRWHEDAAGFQNNLYQEGLTKVIITCFVYLMASLFMAIGLHWFTSMQQGTIGKSSEYVK